jgi:hypothetical protein
MEKEIIKRGNESGYETLIIQGKWTSLELTSVDKDGDIEIELNNTDENISLYLNQNEIKEVIEFLQKQIISPSN